MTYYDRQGQPLTLYEWAVLMENIPYKQVAQYEDERVLISTVWLGLDHNWTGGRPLIFETMIFATDKNIAYDQSQWRWHTEQEAKECHEIIVACYHENLNPRHSLIIKLASSS